MITTFAELPSSGGLQNVYTPLPQNMHFGLCVIASVVYLLQFYRKGSWHYPLLMFAVDITFLTQTSLCYKDGFISLLAAAEAALLTASILTYISYAKKLKAKRAAAEAEEADQEERRKNAERTQAENDKNLVDNAFEDSE